MKISKLLIFFIFFLCFSQDCFPQSKSVEDYLAKFDEAAKENMPTKALNIAREAYKKYPGSIEIMASLGDAYCELDHNKESVKWFRKVLQRDHNHVGALIGLTENYVNTGDFHSAIECMKKIDALYPNNAVTPRYLEKMAIARAYKDKYGKFPDMRRQTFRKDQTNTSTSDY